MYLADASNLATSLLTASDPVPVTGDYARALRAIGQDVTDLFPNVLEIETDGVNYAARGQSHPNPFQQVKKDALRRIWNKFFKRKPKAGQTAPEPSGATFSRTYTPEDIDRLDRLYATQRTGQRKRPDAYSLAERLRTMGSIVNARKGRLKQLRKHADHLLVEYWDEGEKIQTAKLTTVILYRNHQSQTLPSDAPAPKELWEGYDF